MPKLMEKIVMGRNFDRGAPTVLITGRLGSGKTSLLAHIARRILEKKEEDDSRPQDEKLFWRGQESCQFLKLHDKVPYQVWVPEGRTVEFISPNGFDLDEKRFSTFKELYDRADPHKVNVVYMSFLRLADFMAWLQRNVFDWNSILVDEVEDLAPMGVGGEGYERVKRVANLLKECRKYRLSFYATTQSHSDVDWRVTKKIMCPIFLHGAVPLKESPIWRRTIQALSMGQGWVSVGGNYEKFEYPAYPTPIDVRARMDGGDGSG